MNGVRTPEVDQRGVSSCIQKDGHGLVPLRYDGTLQCCATIPVLWLCQKRVSVSASNMWKHLVPNSDNFVVYGVLHACNCAPTVQNSRIVLQNLCIVWRLVYCMVVDSLHQFT